MFRKISSVFLILFFWFILFGNLGFAASDYLSSWTTVRKTCVKGLTSPQTGVTKAAVSDEPTTCKLNPPTYEPLNTAIDWFEDEDGKYIKLFQLVKTDEGYVIDVTECASPKLDNCSIPKRKDIKSISPFTLQKMDLEAFISRDLVKNNQEVVPNRLFTTGANTAALRNDYVAYTLDANDFPASAKSVVFANPATKTSLGASVAPDGGMAVQLIADNSSWTLITRRLKNGLPIGAPFSWTVPAYTGYSPDITNAIEVNNGIAGASAIRIRYLVFRAFRNVGTATQQSQILRITIDDATGKPLGSATAITGFAKAFQATAEAIQSLAIAPDGKLMLFTIYAEACKRQILKKVDLSNGEVVGAATTVVNCSGLASTPGGVVGVDIMLPETVPAAASK